MADYWCESRWVTQKANEAKISYAHFMFLGLPYRSTQSFRNYISVSLHMYVNVLG